MVKRPVVKDRKYWFKLIGVPVILCVLMMLIIFGGSIIFNNMGK